MSHTPRVLPFLLGLALVLAGCGSASGASSRAFRFFSPEGFWNRMVPAGAEIDPRSRGVTRSLLREVERERRAEVPPTINTIRWSVPIYTVGPNQPTVRVRNDNGGPSNALQRAWNAVPLPLDAHPAAGTDQHLVVWQPSSNRLWEFWRLQQTAAGWEARWGGAMRRVSENRGSYGPEAWPRATTHWGASASSLSIAGGLITFSDLRHGRIEHALAIGVPNVRAGVYSLPARRTDGTASGLNRLPEGAHLRLDPKLDLGSLELPPLTRMIAEAAQRYGLFVRSRGGHVVFYGQDPTPLGYNPYRGEDGYFEGEEPAELLASFPWGRLQLLRMQLRGSEP
jgi:hypothetical protein